MIENSLSLQQTTAEYAEPALALVGGSASLEVLRLLLEAVVQFLRIYLRA